MSENNSFGCVIVILIVIAIGVLSIAYQFTFHQPSPDLIEWSQYLFGFIGLVVFGFLCYLLIYVLLEEARKKSKRTDLALASMREEFLKRHAELDKKYEKQIRSLKKNQAKLLLALAFIVNVIQTIASSLFNKGFNEDSLFTLSVSLFLFLLFQVGLHLLGNDKRPYRIAGGFFYGLGILLIPALAFFYHNLSFETILKNIAELDFNVLASAFLTVLLIFVAPILLFGERDDSSSASTDNHLSAENPDPST